MPVSVSLGALPPVISSIIVSHDSRRDFQWVFRNRFEMLTEDMTAVIRIWIHATLSLLAPDVCFPLLFFLGHARLVSDIHTNFQSSWRKPWGWMLIVHRPRGQDHYGRQQHTGNGCPYGQKDVFCKKSDQECNNLAVWTLIWWVFCPGDMKEVGCCRNVRLICQVMLTAAYQLASDLRSPDVASPPMAG